MPEPHTHTHTFSFALAGVLRRIRVFICLNEKARVHFDRKWAPERRRYRREDGRTIKRWKWAHTQSPLSDTPAIWMSVWLAGAGAAFEWHVKQVRFKQGEEQEWEAKGQRWSMKLMKALLRKRMNAKDATVKTRVLRRPLKANCFADVQIKDAVGGDTIRWKRRCAQLRRFGAWVSIVVSTVVVMWRAIGRSAKTVFWFEKWKHN